MKGKYVLGLYLISFILLFSIPIAIAEQHELPEPGVMPDSKMYGFKRFFEGVNLFFTFDDVAKAEKHAKYAGLRLSEAKAMAERGKPEFVDQSLKDYENNIQRSNELAEKAQQTGRDVTKVTEQVGLATLVHLEVLDDVYERVPEEAAGFIAEFDVCTSLKQIGPIVPPVQVEPVPVAPLRIEPQVPKQVEPQPIFPSQIEPLPIGPGPMMPLEGEPQLIDSQQEPGQVEPQLVGSQQIEPRQGESQQGEPQPELTGRVVQALSPRIEGNPTNNDNPTYETIQEAVDAAQEDSALIAVINICPGIYKEDIKIHTTKTIKFIGQGSVIVTGSGKDSSIFGIFDGCVTEGDKYCFGTTVFENIDIKKTTDEEKPKYAIILENGLCIGPCDRFDRAKISFSDGTIEGFASYGITLIGKVDLILNNATIKNIGVEDVIGHFSAIEATKGQPIIPSGSPEASICDFDSNAHITIENSNFYNNKGIFGTVLFAAHAQITMDNVNVYDNTGTSLIDIDCSNLTFTNSAFYDNVIEGGQMIVVDADSQMHFYSSEVYDNSGTHKGTFLDTLGVVDIANSIISNNNADKQGGGIYFRTTTGNFTACCTLKSTSTCWSGNTPEDLYHEETETSYNFDCDDFMCDESGCS